ncbi:MotE family protein [Marinisporobacter balticus]|uniref:Flagellar motility protein MotE (MotC chaperone) n=1 Tax=Marinisporobacter balticus TaxID=2018667 RepID=A0A4R2L3Y9_9FIRM|nr:hypothetical protein [Marinisporobacter balticus]TCO79947.1 hypothetical protein EV214_101181 [Marinisporobacter balticus]
MAKSNIVEKEKKSMGIGKILGTVVVVFITIPLMIMSILYFTNDNYKFIINQYLSKISGPIGVYFESYPTRDEKEGQKREVAKYLVNLDIESASDKLTIIQKEDEKLYADLLKICTQINGNQTNKILEYMRQSAIKKDVLSSIIEQIKGDQIKELQEKAKYYETTALVNAVEEINDNLTSEMVSYKNIGLTLEQMKEENAAEILKYLDKDVAIRLLSNYQSKNKRKKVDELLRRMEEREKELINIANIYNVEKAEKLLADIGDENNYKPEELSIVYRNMDRLKAAQILSKIEDKNFTYKLLEQIKNDELIVNGKDTVTSDMMSAMKIYREYDQEIDELTKVYGKMEPTQIGAVITKLFKSRNMPKKYAFQNGEEIIITDQEIAVNILKKLKEKTVAEILATLDSSLASELSKKLTLP